MWILLIFIIIVILVCFICHIKFGGLYEYNNDIEIISPDKIVISYGTFTKIPNYGQCNAGVYVNDEKKYIIIADYNKIGISVNKFKTKYGDLFPSLYEIYLKNKIYYSVWERYLNDISKLLFVDIPKVILGDSEEFRLYEIILPFKQPPHEKTPTHLFIQQIKDINANWTMHFSKVTLDKYKKIIDCVKTVLDKYIPIFAQQIIKLKLKSYGDRILNDNKYDNYAYKIINDQIKIVAIDVDSNLSDNNDIKKMHAIFKQLKDNIYDHDRDSNNIIDKLEIEINSPNLHIMKITPKKMFFHEFTKYKPRKFKWKCFCNSLDEIFSKVRILVDYSLLNESFKEILLYSTTYEDNIKFGILDEVNYDEISEKEAEELLYDYCQLPIVYDPLIIAGLKKLHSI
jgi:hypothetical protein